jgi:hypothetical protein
LDSEMIAFSAAVSMTAQEIKVVYSEPL